MTGVLALPAAAPPPDRTCVFTTVKVLGGQPLHWDRHRSRLLQSCAELFRAEPAPDLDVRVQELAAAAGRGRLRVDARATGAGHVSVEVEVLPLPAPPTAPQHLVAVSGRTGSWRHKWCDRAQLAAAQQLVGSGAVPLFVDAAGHLLETVTANVVLVDGCSIWTPPPSDSILPGVTLEVLLERARDDGFDVEARPVPLEAAADRVVLTSSSVSGLREVASLGPLPVRRDPALLRRLRQLLDEPPLQAGPVA